MTRAIYSNIKFILHKIYDETPRGRITGPYGLQMIINDNINWNTRQGGNIDPTYAGFAA